MCFLGVLRLIPASMLLVLSFFVLFTVTKCADRRLKIFGVVISVFLWLSCIIIFAGGILEVSRGAWRRPLNRRQYIGGKCNTPRPGSGAMRGQQAPMNRMPQTVPSDAQAQ